MNSVALSDAGCPVVGSARVLGRIVVGILRLAIPTNARGWVISVVTIRVNAWVDFIHHVGGIGPGCGGRAMSCGAGAIARNVGVRVGSVVKVRVNAWVDFVQHIGRMRSSCGGRAMSCGGRAISCGAGAIAGNVGVKVGSVVKVRVNAWVDFIHYVGRMWSRCGRRSGAHSMVTVMGIVSAWSASRGVESWIHSVCCRGIVRTVTRNGVSGGGCDGIVMSLVAGYDILCLVEEV
jgi:hypothetical protein